MGVAVADVSGHDVGGALLAAAFRACLKAESRDSQTPASLVEAINQTLFNDLLQAEQFISMFYLLYDPVKRLLRYTNAGHNPPLLWHAKEKSGEWLFTNDSLLGIEPIYHYHEKKRELAKGDVLVLYTDGLTEAVGDSGKPFGNAGLEEALHRAVVGSATEILASLLATWKKFMGSKPPKDDVTLVVLKT